MGHVSESNADCITLFKSHLPLSIIGHDVNPFNVGLSGEDVHLSLGDGHTVSVVVTERAAHLMLVAGGKTNTANSWTGANFELWKFNLVIKFDSQRNYLFLNLSGIAPFSRGFLCLSFSPTETTSIRFKAFYPGWGPLTATTVFS